MDTLVPRAVQIDASSHCQLACPVCPTANGLTRPTLGAGHLKLSDFEGLLDRNPQIRAVELSNYGEMFLNPQLPELLECAYERRVVVSGGNGVNLNFASEAALQAVVKYRVRSLTCSIDGATQDTYARYRVNGNLDRVLENVDRIRDLRRSAGAAFPLLDWQFVVMGHNEREIARAREMASARGMGFLPRLSWSADHAPVSDRELVRIETGLGASSRDEFRERKGAEYTRDLCYQLWHQPVINWDGRMLGCCVNYWGDFGGNVFTEGLDAAMQHPTIEYARQMLLGAVESRDGIPCTTCDQYKAISRSKNWLVAEELQESEYGNFLAGIVPVAAPDCRFARIFIEQGCASAPRFDVAGRLFRFGVDTAVYFRPVSAGPYTLFVSCLERGGWGDPAGFVLEVEPSPLCQEFRVELRDGRVPRSDQSARVSRVRPLPYWIR